MLMLVLMLLLVLVSVCEQITLILRYTNECNPNMWLDSHFALYRGLYADDREYIGAL